MLLFPPLYVAQEKKLQSRIVYFFQKSPERKNKDFHCEPYDYCFPVRKLLLVGQLLTQQKPCAASQKNQCLHKGTLSRKTEPRKGEIQTQPEKKFFTLQVLATEVGETFSPSGCGSPL
jgi:hypothetical protein